MPDLLAIVSKAVFELAQRADSLDVGEVWATTRYASTGVALQPLADGGRLFLVTVRPPDEALWLVAILERPRFDGKGWTAKPNATPIRDITSLRSTIEFASGATLPAKAGVLAMSLQTPRELAAATATALASGKGVKVATRAPKAGKAAKRAVTAARPAKLQAPEGPAIDQVALLAMWRKTRSPAIADVLQAVPVDAAWNDRLASIRRAKPTVAARRIRELPDDPRVTVFLVECVQKARWPGSSAWTLWTHAFAKLVALHDVRAVPPLRAAVATPPHFFGAAFTARIVGQIRETAEALTSYKPKEDAGEAALIAAQPVAIPDGGWLPAAKSGGDAEALLAGVWAAPEDDGVRAVAADALLEQGDPWGELISLQLLGGTKHRDTVAALIRKHGKRFAGPLAEVGAVAKMKFEKGFVASCVVDRGMVGRRWWDLCAKAPQWATVRSVSIGLFEVPLWWVAAWYANAPLANLREVELGSVVFRRASATAAWSVAAAPQRLNERVARMVSAFLAALPPAERARMPAPASIGIRTMLADLA